MLGHGSASLTLDRYAHLIPSDSLAAAEKVAELLLVGSSVTKDGHSVSASEERTEPEYVI
jgi:hypothetical protein